MTETTFRKPFLPPDRSAVAAEWKRSFIRSTTVATLAVEDFDREARVALAQYRLQRLMDDRVAAKLAEHDQRVAAKLAKHDEIWCEAIGRALAHERQLGRAEVEKADLRLRGRWRGGA